MRRVDEQPIDPEVADALDAIDATLAGEPVEPRFAELAELALLLQADRPQPTPAFQETLDQRVATRFAWEQAPARRRRTWFRVSPAWGGGGALAVAAALIAVVVLTVGGGGGSSSSSDQTAAISTTTAPSVASGATRAPAPKHATSQTPTLFSAPTQASRATYGAASSASSSSAAPAPTPSGRKTIQSAQLSLTTPPARIDAVAQEVFNVVGAQNGYVQHSTVTASSNPNAYAQFTLSVPSSNLSQAMAQLSQLKYASVSSRTDATQDVNNQYVGDVRRLADAKALRTALLKRLAQALTTTEIDSLDQQIHDADQAISSAQAAVNSLNHQVDYSQVEVTINAAAIAPAHHHKSGGFTLGKATHDAGRVLTVAAGVALIVLAALVPVALLAVLGWWVVTTVRRRRREQALDLA